MLKNSQLIENISIYMKNSPLSDDDCKVFNINESWYCYIPITKVSSTYLRRALPGDRFNIHQWSWYDKSGPVPDTAEMNYLVVLRDPVQRWISGVLEFWCRAYPDKDWTSAQNIDWVFDQIEFDQHTQPQVDFISHVVKERCTWLWMNSTVETNSWFSKNNIRLAPVSDNDRNQGNSRPLMYFGPNQERSYEFKPGYISSTSSALIQQTLRQSLDENPARVEIIKKYYQSDYNLIQSVEFFGGPTRT